MSNSRLRSMRLLIVLGMLFTTSTMRGQIQSPASKLAADRNSPIDLAEAKTRFAEAKKLAQADHGQLWGKSVEGPMMFVDPRTRYVVGNQADAEGLLKPAGDVFIGKLPPKIPIANTACQWAGVHWSMVLWPLPEDETTRTILLMHESWHRIQNDLGLPPLDPPNAHLDTMPGRYWLQLEWRALARALTTQGAQDAKRPSKMPCFSAGIAVNCSRDPRRKRTNWSFMKGLPNTRGSNSARFRPTKSESMWTNKSRRCRR